MVDKLVIHDKLHVHLNSSFLHRGGEIECFIRLLIRIEPIVLGFATMSSDRRSEFFTVDNESIVLNFDFEIFWVDLEMRDLDS
jgi:hypothetical protein